MRFALGFVLGLLVLQIGYVVRPYFAPEKPRAIKPINLSPEFTSRCPDGFVGEVAPPKITSMGAAKRLCVRG